MIQLTSSTKILLAIESMGFRKGIDGISKLIKSDLELDPMVGSAFVLHSRCST